MIQSNNVPQKPLVLSRKTIADMQDIELAQLSVQYTNLLKAHGIDNEQIECYNNILATQYLRIYRQFGDEGGFGV